jgi:vacuolar-type H+-ATPase subunit I/STV1
MADPPPDQLQPLWMPQSALAILVLQELPCHTLNDVNLKLEEKKTSLREESEEVEQSLHLEAQNLTEEINSWKRVLQNEKGSLNPLRTTQRLANAQEAHDQRMGELGMYINNLNQQLFKLEMSKDRVGSVIKLIRQEKRRRDLEMLRQPQ